MLDIGPFHPGFMMVLRIAAVALHKLGHVAYLGQPLADEVATAQRTGLVDNGRDTAAAAMAHDDNVLNLQLQHPEFKRSRGRMMIAVRRVGRHKVRHIADHENFTRTGIKNDLRCSAEITAGDDHYRRLLAVCRQGVIALPFADKGFSAKAAIPLAQTLWKRARQMIAPSCLGFRNAPSEALLHRKPTQCQYSVRRYPWLPKGHFPPSTGP